MALTDDNGNGFYMPVAPAYGGGNGGNGRSNARGYSRDSEELVETLRELEMDTQDEETRRMIQKFIKQAEM